MRRPLALVLLVFGLALAAARPLAAQAEADTAEAVAVALAPGAALHAVTGALVRAGFVVADASPAGTVRGERYGTGGTYAAYAVVVPASVGGDSSVSRAYFRLVFVPADVSPSTSGGQPRMVPRTARAAADAWARLDAAKRELAQIVAAHR